MQHKLIATLLVGVLLGGCKAVTMAYGPDAATAKANADAVAAALEQRYTRVIRQPKFANARLRIGRYAMAPSKIANDTALWTTMRTTSAGAERDLEVSGSVVDGAYTFVTRLTPPEVQRLGDSRHYVGLRQLDAKNDWLWITTVANAVGPLPPQRTNDIMRALFASSERPAPAVRADYRAAFPRTTVAFGRLATLDSIATAPQADGSTLVTLRVLMDADRIKGTFPALSRYVGKYVAPSKYRFRLSDRTGSDYFDVTGAKSAFTMRFRTRNGDLQPISGPSRAMPDTLTLRVEMAAKLSVFTVGFSDLVGEFVHVNTPTDRAWSMRFTREPKWDLPLIGERLLQSPLRRPFTGDGVRFRIGFTSDGNGQTVFGRTAVVAVRESAVMRFIGNLGFTAMSDFDGAVEVEENRFLAEAFAAMRADIASQ